MAQSVERPALDLGPGHDLLVHEFEPRAGLCADSGEPVRDPLSPLSLALTCSLSVSQKQTKLKKSNIY